MRRKVLWGALALCAIALMGVCFGALMLGVLSQFIVPVPSDTDTVEMRQHREIKAGDVVEIQPIKDAWKWELVGFASRSNLKFGYAVTVEKDYKVTVNEDLSFKVRRLSDGTIKFISSKIYPDTAFMIVATNSPTYKVAFVDNQVRILRGAFCGEPKFEPYTYKDTGKTVQMHLPNCENFDPVNANAHGYMLLPPQNWAAPQIVHRADGDWLIIQNHEFKLEGQPLPVDVRLALIPKDANLHARFETVYRTYTINNGQTTVSDIAYYRPVLIWADDGSVVYRAPEK